MHREDAESPDSEEASDDEEASVVESSDEEDEPAPAVRSYASLMRSLVAEAVPHAKRRKLDHVTELANEENSDAEFDDTDQVDEPEEGPETAVEGVLQDGDDLEDSSDPFEVHFAAPDDNVLLQRLKALELSQWTTQKLSLPRFSKSLMSVPQGEALTAATPVSVSNIGELKLKRKLATALAEQKPAFDDLEKSIAPMIFGYQDMFYCERNTATSESLRRLTCLHAINHVFK